MVRGRRVNHGREKDSKREASWREQKAEGAHLELQAQNRESARELHGEVPLTLKAHLQ